MSNSGNAKFVLTLEQLDSWNRFNGIFPKESDWPKTTAQVVTVLNSLGISVSKETVHKILSKVAVEFAAEGRNYKWTQDDVQQLADYISSGKTGLSSGVCVPQWMNASTAARYLKGISAYEWLIHKMNYIRQTQQPTLATDENKVLVSVYPTFQDWSDIPFESILLIYGDCDCPRFPNFEFKPSKTA